jgi:hypothetical protein
VGTIVDEFLKNAAMQAGAIFTHPDLLARLRSGELTPEQAVQQMQEQGLNIFGGDIEADPAVTAAMLRVLLEGPA